ncbi:hypothetical protein ASPCADRAFT_166689 [Aspergillus carbonarius ITEM 5010]|uniref:Zn(2)-C6 fungal-type domain-containing protein n=1 Tax=Aspergillus carbonarius (strain ITEM 5010) TaxID=602072 RepID=A0A1R3RT24_ASPC5|nr:hypothetical protein ASPCADRAFT_166689 [Aspergillus carbonarius ITEM 5010]
MFSNFASSRTPLTAKRRKVSRACDFCRQHRVRCEATVPCPPCVANDVTCTRQVASTAQRLPGTDPVNQGRRSSSSLSRDGERLPSSAVESRPGALSTQVSVPSPSHSSAQRTDSMLGFIARINTFCSGVSQLAWTSTSWGYSPDPDYTSPFPPNVLQEATPTECNLTDAQISRLLAIFWTRLQPLAPIVRRDDFNSANRTSPDQAWPLRDAIIAYTMQYVYCSGLHTRLLGLHWDQFQPEKQPSMTGLPYFQRCLQATTQYISFSQPSVVTLQCYCFMALYLLDAGQHSAAYNMIGLALRIAQSLHLDIETQAEPAVQDCQLFHRIWWTLNHLDFRCARHLGKPVSVRLQDCVCPLPTSESLNLLDPGSALYHTQSIRLTAAALAIIESTGCISVPAHRPKENADNETRAQILSEELRHLQQWRQDLQSTGSFGHLTLEVEDTPVDPDKEPEVELNYITRQPIEILLTTLLKLQYHNVIITLHRVFIQFPSHPLVPKSSPRADAHSATALNHALAMIKFTHHRMATCDILHGVPEVYQYQWNAVLTLVGFMLAYPYCHRCPRARRYIRLALEIFDSAGSNSPATVRAAALTRHLSAKVDTLLRILNIEDPLVPIQNSQEGDPQRSQQDHATSAMTPAANGPIPQDEVPPPVPGLPELGTDSLWSWADLMNLEAWPDYCDEVGEAFTDPTKFCMP